jgi:hypothetical protein
MTTRIPIHVLPLAAALSLLCSAPAAASTFVYEGRLDDAGRPATGRYDLSLTAFPAEKQGSTLAAPMVFEDVDVRDGRFRLEFDLAAPGVDNAWLELGVRDGAAAGAFAGIPGRTKAIAAPLIGACWSSTGDSGVNPATNFIGTTDDQPLVVRSNNTEAARFGQRAIGLFGPPVAGTELTIRSNDPVNQFANVFLERNSSGAEREGVLISVGSGATGSNNQSLFLDQYNAINQEQKRRLIIDGNGLMTLPGPGLAFGSTTRQMINLWGPSEYGIGVQSSTQYTRTAAGGQFAWFAGGAHNDAALNPGTGGARTMSLNADGQLELVNGSATVSPRIRLSFGTTGLLANRFWDIAAARNSVSPGGPVIPAGSLIFSDDTGIKAAFDVNGLARNDSGTWTSWSDARLKTNVHDIASPLDTLLKMRGHWFEYKDPKAVMAQPGPRLGLIAQEVREAVPQWVSAGPDGMLSVTPTGFEALAIEAMRELRDETTVIDATQADDIKALRAENAELRARLARIEARLARE